MRDILMLVVGFILSVGNGLFVAAEFSLVNLDRRELEVRRKKGETGLDSVIEALKITSTHLSSAQLGITLTTLLTGYTFQPAVSNLVREPMLAMGLPTATVTGAGAVIGVALATAISMIVGELIPKNFALSLPLPTAKRVVPFQAAFTRAFYVIIKIFNDTANRAVRLFRIEPKEEISGARTAEELSSLVRHSALEGVLDLEQAALLTRTLRFSNHSAVEVMTPRVKVEFVQANDSVESLIAKSRDTGFSRFPVFRESFDHIVGVAHLKHAYALPIQEWSNTPVSQITSKVSFVPETQGVDTLLGEIRGHGHQIAVVLDEYGGTTGIVTLEDLAEELVGELTDEHDAAENAIERLDDRLIIDAGLRPDELHDWTGLEIPENGEYETLGGFMASSLDRVPEVGDSVDLESGELSVRSMDRATVLEIEYVSNDPENDSALDSLEERIRKLRIKEESDE